MTEVSVTACPDYSEKNVRAALDNAIGAVGGLDWVVQGMKIAIKANLVSFMAPDKAATTHPALLCALCDMLSERGASVIIGDSPGGLYNAAFVGKVYSATGMHAAEAHGGRLNSDFGQSEAHFPAAAQAKSFTYTSYLDSADAIIDFCKLKSHGMMGMSCAVKNMFGVVPGTMKPEYHYRYPNHADFADMLVDLNEYFAPKVKLCLCDAVVGMEGNGPTAGDPKQIGAVIASASPYLLDLVAAKIIGLDISTVPTLEAAYRRGLAPDSADKVNVSAGYGDFISADFKNLPHHESLEFSADGKGGFTAGVLKALLRSKPVVKKAECVGCGVCMRVCPASAIVIKDKKAVIDRTKCIRCFCCQEFCPKGAMKVGRTLVARAVTHGKRR